MDPENNQQPVNPYQIRKEEKKREEENRLGVIKRKRKVVRALNIFVAIVILVLAGWGLVRWLTKSEAELPGVAVPIQPRDHIKLGDPIPGLYLSNPPVSGWHYPDPANWGIYDKELADQTVIHNLEHGGIWISYKTPDVSPELVAKLKEVAGRYKTKVILTPRAANDSLIAVAAWGRLDKFDYFDETRLVKFIRAFINKGPENVP